MVEQFSRLLDNLGIQLTKTQEDQFDVYYKMLVEWNNNLNLTSIIERDEVYIKHFYDSICLIKSMPISNQTLLDVGSGAGFPSIPLKIIYPELNVTIIDALQKRITFLEELTKALNLKVELLHQRAEEFKRREAYELVTARAVANLQILSELCIPFVKTGGYFLAMKGPSFETELKDSKKAFQLLNARFDSVYEYRIADYDRSIIKVQKIGITPIKYPRRFNKIKSKPL